MPVIIGSSADLAGKNMASFLKADGLNVVFADNSLDYNGPVSDLNIFVSKHESVKKVNSLTCHAPGNFGRAEFGGADNCLSVSNALVQSECLRRLKALNNLSEWGFNVSLEVTHHGPCSDSPSLFVEIGSSVKEWSNLEYCRGVADVVKSLVKDYSMIMASKSSSCIGVGGSHYAPSFTKILLDDASVNMGHVCPDYAMKSLDLSMFKQMVEKTVPRPVLVFINKKVSGDKLHGVIDWCNDLDLSYKRLK